MISDDEVAKVMPIVVIYMLGFRLTGTSQVAVKIKRTGDDIISGGSSDIKDPIVDALTHDAYFIQVSRMKKEMFGNLKDRTDLLKILSLFEQDYFVDKKFIKIYPYPVTHKTIKKMITALERISIDPKTRRIMEEQEFDALNEAFWHNVVARKDKELAQTRKAHAKELSQKDKVIEELRKKLGIN